MKLIIKRNQRDEKGIFGGHKGVNFILSCRVELTDEERELIDRYKAWDYPLTYKEIGGTQVANYTVDALVNGRTQEVKDVATLLHNEEVVKKACDDFKNLLQIMTTFGGEEVIEY